MNSVISRNDNDDDDDDNDDDNNDDDNDNDNDNDNDYDGVAILKFILHLDKTKKTLFFSFLDTPVGTRTKGS